jgi:hypothetical protein
VYDVVADEDRGLLHVTTCADELGDYCWYKYDTGGGQFEGLGPRLHKNAHPLLAPDGRVYVLTHDGQLACYDPDADEVAVRPLMTGPDERFEPGSTIYQCEIAPDGATAYVLPWREPVIYALDLRADDAHVRMELRGRWSSAERCSTMDPCFGPDGKLYIVSGWGEAVGGRAETFLHVVTYDPRTGQVRDEGVLTVGDPDALVVALGSQTPIGKPPYHGLRRLPDGTLYPRYAQGIAVGEDGAVYVMTLSPLMVLRLAPLGVSPL